MFHFCDSVHPGDSVEGRGNREFLLTKFTWLSRTLTASLRVWMHNVLYDCTMPEVIFDIYLKGRTALQCACPRHSNNSANLLKVVPLEVVIFRDYLTHGCHMMYNQYNMYSGVGRFSWRAGRVITMAATDRN